MSKRRVDKDSFFSSPKRRKLNNAQIDADEIYVPSPSPPQIIVSDIMTKMALRPPSYSPRRQSPPKNQRSQNVKSIFADCTFFIACIGKRNERTNRIKKWDGLNKKRVELFEKLIPKNGGVIIKDLNDFDAKKEGKLIIIVSQKIKRADFDNLFDENMVQNYVFVTSDFITFSLRNQRKESFEKFKPKCLMPQQRDIRMMEKAQNNKVQTETNDDFKEVDLTKFACQIENNGHCINHNLKITQIFDEMVSIYTCLGKKWESYSYKKSSGIIKKYPKQIKTQNDIKQLCKMKGFGEETGIKVMQIINGKFKKLQELKQRPLIQAIDQFTKIFGVGTVTAKKWFNMGCRTLDDLKSDRFGIKLTNQQKVGLKYCDDLNLKIPRNEIKQIEMFLNNELNALCPGAKMVICGSYRRGKLQSGDIDCLITHSNVEKTDNLLMRFVDRLHQIGFIVDDLSGSSDKNGEGQKKSCSFTGICKLNHVKYAHYRHIDIKVYKPQHFAFAVLYFTGSDHFNRSMRFYARENGFTLSDTHLCPIVKVGKEKIFTFTEKAIKCETERDIFKALGLKYIEPAYRNTYECFGQSTNMNGNDSDTKEETP